MSAMLSDDASTQEEWEDVTLRNPGYNQYVVTQRLRVPGGYLYRTIVDVMSEGGSLVVTTAVAMVFVPSPSREGTAP